MGNGTPSGKAGAGVYISPIASSGTSEMDTKNSQGKVSGTPDHKGTPDPLGYLKAGHKG